MEAQVGQSLIDHFGLVGDEKKDIPALCPGEAENLAALFFREELGDRRLPVPFRELDPCQSFGAVLAYKGCQVIELFAREVRSAGHFDPLDQAPFFYGAEKDFDLRPFKGRRKIDQLTAKTEIRFVSPVTGQRLFPGDVRERLLELESLQLFEQRRYHPFDHSDHVFRLDKGHLHVQLRKLRLSIRPQILVTETADDLKIAVQPSHHKNLLEKLRR